MFDLTNTSTFILQTAVVCELKSPNGFQDDEIKKKTRNIIFPLFRVTYQAFP